MSKSEVSGVVTHVDASTPITDMVRAASNSQVKDQRIYLEMSDLGLLPSDEQDMVNHATAADLMAFLDSQRATMAVDFKDGSGWCIQFTEGAFLVNTWGRDQEIKLERKCSTLTEAVDVVRRYEQMLPL